MTPESDKRIRALGLNQKRFGAEVGISYEQVSRWGKRGRGLVVLSEPRWVSSWLAAWEAVRDAGKPLPWADTEASR